MEKIEVLSQHLRCNIIDIEYKGNKTFHFNNDNYLVFSLSEMNDEAYKLAYQLAYEAKQRIPLDLRGYFMFTEYIDDNCVPEVIGDYEIFIDDENEFYIYEL